MPRTKNKVFIVIRKTVWNGKSESIPCSLGPIYAAPKFLPTMANRCCRRYGVLYQADEGATVFPNRRAAYRAVCRTLQFSRDADLSAWPKNEQDLEIVTVNLGKVVKKGYSLAA